MCVSLSLFIYLSFSLSLYLSLSLCLLSKLRHLPTLGMDEETFVCVRLSLSLSLFVSLFSLSLSLSVSLFSLSDLSLILNWGICYPWYAKSVDEETFVCVRLSVSLSLFVSLFSLSVPLCLSLLSLCLYLLF